MPLSPSEPSPLATGLAALAAGEWEGAREALEQAVAAGEEPAALEALGWACWWLDQTERSLDLRERAYRLYLDADEPRSAGRVATALAVHSFDVRGEAVGAGWLQRAKRLLADLPAGAEQGWLALWEGHFARLVERDATRAGELAARARELGVALGLRDLELLAVGLEGLLLVGEGRVVEGMRRLDEATAAAVAGEIRELDAVAQACCFLIYACEQSWDHERLAQWGGRIDAFCARWKVDSLFAVCRTQHAAMLLRRGDWPAAESQLATALEALAASRPASAAQGAAQLAELRRRQGRPAEAVALLGRAEGLSAALVCRAALALDEGDPETAAALLGRALRRAAPDNWGLRATALELSVRAHLAAGDRPGACEDAAALQAIAAVVATPSFTALTRIAEGLLALGAGELQSAREALEDAVDLFAGGFPYEASRARLDLAGVLAGLGFTPLAKAEARAAREALLRLGAIREAERAAALLDDLFSPASSAPATPAAPAAASALLTARELQVLKLVAQGLSDKGVATRLHLSEHTVHRHVANVLAKLDVPSRTAAVARASRAGLL